MTTAARPAHDHEFDEDDPDVIDLPPREALELRRPAVPITLEQLAALKGEAAEIIQARATVLSTLRTAAIRATSPEDWILYKAPEDLGGQIVGYLQDCGCDRVRDLYGIEVFDVSRPEKIAGTDSGTFVYLMHGSGRCKLTRQTLEDVEGGRSSTDDFCKDKTGAELELTVRKATRANLDGNITRELAGMKSVPLEELVAAWNGTSKNADRCRRGRGFGSRSVRLGANPENAPNLEPPVCPHCNAKGVYRAGKGDRGAFYGCPNFQQHPDKKFIINADEWQAKQHQQAAPATPASQPAAATPATRTSSTRRSDPPAKADPLGAGDIFGGVRTPGEEG